MPPSATTRTCSGRMPSFRSASAGRGDDVHRRRADEARREDRRRPRVEVGGRRVLLDPAAAQQHDLVGHAHRLGLVVGDVDHRHAELLLQRADLAPHLLAQLRIEVRQRLVHQADRRLGDDRAAERDALLLAARELRGLALEQRRRGRAGRRRDRGGARARRPARRRTLTPNTMFSRDVRCGNSAYDWNTIEMRRCAGATPVTSRSPIKMRPALGVSSPAIMRSVVDLPQPDGPSRTTSLPDVGREAGVVDRLRRAPVLADALEAKLHPASFDAAPRPLQPGEPPSGVARREHAARSCAPASRGHPTSGLASRKHSVTLEKQLDSGRSKERG